jgi:hypothetical protein
MSTGASASTESTSIVTYVGLAFSEWGKGRGITRSHASERISRRTSSRPRNRRERVRPPAR